MKTHTQSHIHTQPEACLQSRYSQSGSDFRSSSPGIRLQGSSVTDGSSAVDKLPGDSTTEIRPAEFSTKTLCPEKKQKKHTILMKIVHQNANIILLYPDVCQRQMAFAALRFMLSFRLTHFCE